MAASVLCREKGPLVQLNGPSKSGLLPLKIGPTSKRIIHPKDANGAAFCGIMFGPIECVVALARP